MEICDQQRSPVADVLRAGLLKLNVSREDMSADMESVARFAVFQLEARLSMLTTIGQVAPLLGFLGTVSGMAVSFYTINSRAAAMNPLTMADVAGGMWQALIATIAGMTVATPTLLAYRYFIDRRDSYVIEMERLATELLHASDYWRSSAAGE
ncbi:MAG: MotA/TolQ/ExbB proton channel family protein [Candidatus Omnitrophica bacterium]|nr:MotA/TolQ/ExbB proton channel family protein [Candidatus Omnitrophota bacterium]